MNTIMLALKREQIEKGQLFWSETWRLFLVDSFGLSETKEEEKGKDWERNRGCIWPAEHDSKTG